MPPYEIRRTADVRIKEKNRLAFCPDHVNRAPYLVNKDADDVIVTADHVKETPDQSSVASTWSAIPLT